MCVHVHKLISYYDINFIQKYSTSADQIIIPLILQVRATTSIGYGNYSIASAPNGDAFIAAPESQDSKGILLVCFISFLSYPA